MKKNKIIHPLFGILILTVILLLSLSACSSRQEPKPDAVIWVGFSDQEADALKGIIKKFNEENNLNVLVIKVPFEELKVKYQIAAPAGLGPDIIIGPQDWIGAFGVAQLIAPLTQEEFPKEEREKYNPAGIQGMTYNGELYGVPIVLETLAVIYNKDLVSKEPETMDELLSMAKEFNDPSAKDPSKRNYGFFYDIGNLYYSWGFFSGFGTQIFGESDGKMDLSQIRLDSPETRETLKYLRKMKDDGLIPDGATTDMMSGFFYDKKLMFCLNGPWMVVELKKNNVNFGIIPLPPLPNGERPKPFVGIQGCLLNKKTQHRQLAVKLMHYINKPENQKEMCLASGRIPSNTETLELIQDQPEILKFAEAASYGTPMPNHPVMSAVWEPMGQVLQLVIIHGKNPEEVLPLSVDRIKQNINIMME